MSVHERDNGDRMVHAGDGPQDTHSLLTGAVLAVIICTALVFFGWILWMLPMPDEKSIPVQSSEKGPDIVTGSPPLRIGVILPLTGDAASHGQRYKNALQLAQKEINEIGGIAGRQIVLEWEDGRCEEDAARIAAEKLVDDTPVTYLIAGACSGEYLAAAPIAQKKKIISFSGSATSPKISALGKYVFRTAPSDALAGKAAAVYARKSLQGGTAAVLWENGEYPQALRSAFSEEFTRLGGIITAEESFDTGETDFSNIVTLIRKHPSDVIYILPQSLTSGILLVSAIQKAQIPAQLLTADVLLIRDTSYTQGAFLEGVTGIEFFFDETRPNASAFLQRYQKEYGPDVSDPAYLAGFYDILYLIRAAHLTAFDDPDTVSARLYSIKDREGVLGNISFDANGDPDAPFAIRTIIHGEAVLVEKDTVQNDE